MGSYNISYECISHLVASNNTTLREITIDGENLDEEEITKVVDTIHESSLTQFKLYFGQRIDDVAVLKI